MFRLLPVDAVAPHFENISRRLIDYTDWIQARPPRWAGVGWDTDVWVRVANIAQNVRDDASFWALQQQRFPRLLLVFAVAPKFTTLFRRLIDYSGRGQATLQRSTEVSKVWNV